MIPQTIPNPTKTKYRLSCHMKEQFFHEDDCAGCNHFLECAKQPDGFNYETYCPYCYWMGYWGDCDVRVIPMTYYDPEERYSLCPLCGKETESVDD